jgi:hypothetical protein
MSREIVYPVFISNTPIGQDLYESRSQDRIASSISEHIKSNSSDTTLIGLDGEWGSGKSNTISIIRSKLGPMYHVFIYDTWAHQEDLQRRSFLEEFTDNLFQAQLIDQQKWNDKLKTLLAKKKESIKKTIPKLSNAIVVSIISLITLPIVKIISESTTGQGYKIFFGSIPFLIIFAFWLVKSLQKRKALPLQDLFYIYKEQNLEEVSEETISEDEPSVKKFRKWLNDLSEALSVEVIIVFDNMDRLPPDKIKSIWTLIHTFFSATPFKRLNVIVPFDRRHIQKAFADFNEDNNEEKTNHFINKTFSVIFNVPPGILTDWKNLFRTKYSEAFGPTEEDEFLITRQLLNIHSKSVTPRNIISFINDLVAYKLIWKEEISLRYIALFVLNKEDFAQKPIENILGGKYLSLCQTLFAGDESVVDNMAALFYNINVDIARQVPLQREIEFAIREERYEDLQKYSSNPSFLSILDQIDMTEVPVENYVQTLNQIDLATIFPNSELQIGNIWYRLMGRQMQVKLDKLELKSFHEWLLEKAPLSKQKVYLNYFIQQFYAVENFIGKEYCLAMDRIFSIAKASEPPIDVSLLVKEKTVSADEFVNFLKEAKDQYKLFKVTTDFVKLEEFYIKLLTSEIDTCNSFVYLREKHKFKDLKTAVENLIAINEVDAANVYQVFNLYKALSGITTLNSSIPLTKKIPDQKITEFLDLVEKNSLPYYELISMRVARGNSFSGSGTTFIKIMASTDAILVDHVADKVLHYNEFDHLIIDVLDGGFKLSLEVLKKLILSKKVQKLSLEVILPQFHKIVKMLKIEPKDLFDLLNNWEDELPEILKKELIDNLCPHMSVYETAIETDNALGKSLKGYAHRYIENATEINYAAAFMDRESFLFQLLTLLLTRDRISTLPPEAFNAYKTALISICNTGDSEYLRDLDHNQWNVLYQKSDKSHLQPVVKNIRDFFRKTEITPAQFLFFETMFREIGALKEYSGEFVRKILMAIIKDKDCIKLILQHQEFYMELIYEAGNDAFDFIDTIRSYVEDQNEMTEYVDLDFLINKKLARAVSIGEAVINYETEEGPRQINTTDVLRKLVFETGFLHFPLSGYKEFESIPVEEFTLSVTWIINGITKNMEFEHTKWVRIL